MDTKKSIDKINERVGRDLRKVAVSSDVVFKFKKREKKYGISNEVIYNILRRIMKDWRERNIRNIEEAAPDCTLYEPFFTEKNTLIREIEEKPASYYNLDLLKIYYFPSLPSVVYDIAKCLSVTAEDIDRFYTDVLSFWGCYDKSVFTYELKKNPTRTIERYIVALYVVEKNLPAFVMLNGKNGFKNKIREWFKNIVLKK